MPNPTPDPCVSSRRERGHRLIDRKLLLCCLILATGALAALALFTYARSFPLGRQVQGDSLNYLKIATEFTSFRQAFSYTGDRTYGFPLFLYVVGLVASPDNLALWLTGISLVQFCLHIGACVFFYAFFLKDMFEKAALPSAAAASLGALIMSYPALVTYTSLPLTDTFCVDLLMIAAALGSIGRHVNKAIAHIACLLCGLLLGYTIMVRPSFWPAVVAFCGTSLFEAALNFQRQRTQIFKAASLAAGVLAVIIPALLTGRAAYGRLALQNPQFVKECTQNCLRSGLFSVRVFWSFTHKSKEALPGIRDPFLFKTYGTDPDVNSLGSLAEHLFSKPGAVPFYVGKKTIALFDEPHLQPYLAEETPHWFPPLQRGFETAAFCGFITLLLTLVARPFLKQEPLWIGLPWATLVVLLLMTHGVVQIEGRYGFPVIPFSLASLFLGFAEARRHGSRFLWCWLVALLIAAGVFIHQVRTWDGVIPV